MPRLVLLLTLAGIAWPAAAVIIASGDGTGNTTPPADDPGFARVGRAGLNAVYLGEGWVITAHHVGMAPVLLAGTRYEPVRESWVRVENGPGEPPADLALFRLRDPPDWPPLPIRRAAPEPSMSVLMVGAGRNRGPATEWKGRRGFAWGQGRSMRWGTNEVLEAGITTHLRDGAVTRAFSTDFSSISATEHEAQVAIGDSGGAAFMREGGRWELAGILFASSGYDDQPQRSALFGNRTLIADLSHYRDQILSLMARHRAVYAPGPP